MTPEPGQPTQPPPASYDAIAGFYDDDMGRSAAGEDVAFYLSECRRRSGPVLELGCGTGRVSLPLVRAGLPLVGIDTSLPMLRVLLEKAAALPAETSSRLRVLAMDMRDLSLRARFASVICPYSAFTYLLEETDRQRMLHNVRALLASDGEFLLDVFVPDPALEALPRGEPIFDYRRSLEDGTVLERSKVLSADRAGGCRAITRVYRLLAPDGAQREVTTREWIRPWQPDRLAEHLATAGFSVEVLPDFAPGRIRAGVRMAAFRCRLEK